MYPVHVINLQRRGDRMGRIGARLDALGIAWSRIEAIDAAQVPEAALRRAFGGGWRGRAFPATPGDMACSLSHQMIWREIAEAGQPAVVLEDDARLSAAFRDCLEDDLVAPMRAAGLGVLKMEYWPGPQQSRRQPLGEPVGQIRGGARMFRLCSSFLGTCAYLIRPEAAELALSHHPRMMVPVDHYLFGREAGLGFPLLLPGFLNPAPVLHDVETFASDIAAGRGAAGDPRRRSLLRRLCDARARRLEAQDRRRHGARPVEMRFAEPV
ncbi:glycosyltransferase family 25 protein [Albidovulum sp.]